MPRMPKVYLLNPALHTMGFGFITPRWLYVIAGATPEEVGDPIIIDETVTKFDPDILNPGDIVGIGITTGNCIPGYRALREAKKRGATVIMGGIHTTIFPDEPMEMGADAVVKGGGDVVWPQAIRDALNNKLQKLYAGDMVPGELMGKARWNLLDPNKYMFPSIQFVAGCPENCSFCSVWITEGRKPRRRLIDKVTDEVNELHDMGYRVFIMADDNSTPATLKRIEREKSPAIRKQLEQIREERLQFFSDYQKSVPDNMYAFTQMTAEVAKDPEYLKALHDIGVRAALIGVESFDEKGLESANKTWNPVGQEMIEAIETIQGAGIHVLSSIICGLESDTEATLKTMREFAKKSPSLLTQFTVFSPFPGTVLFREMLRDYEAFNEADGTATPARRKYEMKLLKNRFWLDEDKPVLLVEHPHIPSHVLIEQVRQSWTELYTFGHLWRKVKNNGWPWKVKVAYMLGAKAFKAQYAGYGISADSVKTRKLAFLPSLLLRIAVGLFNKFLRAKPRPIEQPEPREEVFSSR